MYLKEIIIENTRPIESLKKTLPFDEVGNPKPIIIIGQNVAGLIYLGIFESEFYLINCF